MKPENKNTLTTIVEKGEIVLYQPDESIRLEVRIEDETVWLTQQQIADLFGTKRPAITKHLNNIFKCGELDENSVSSILEHTAADGKKYATKFYNLDAILSVGYRVNSVYATSFRCIRKRYGKRIMHCNQAWIHSRRNIKKNLI